MSGADLSTDSLKDLLDVPRSSFVQAVTVWALIWATTVCLPAGGHTSKTNIIVMNMVHGLVASALAARAIVTGGDSTLSTACSVAFFLVDAMVMLDNGRRDRIERLRQGIKKAPRPRWLTYAHHVIGAVFGTFLLFRQSSVCAATCPTRNLYTYAQTNEISTPFYGLYRLSGHPIAGALFALSFFTSRILLNFMYLVPYSWNHCSFQGFMIIAAPYQVLQVIWMILIFEKMVGTFGAAKHEKEEELENVVLGGHTQG